MPKQLRLSLVVARADNGVIGRANALPWHIPADLRHFKRLTVGKSVIMGRRTFESIGKPLPNRRNLVVTTNPDWRALGVEAAESLDAALDLVERSAEAPDEAMIIGGARLFAEAEAVASRIHLTEVHDSPEGDVMIAAFDPAIWIETTREHHEAADDRPAFSFVTLERRRQC